MKINSLVMALLTLLVTSCAKNISSDRYESHQVGEIYTTYPGVIKNVREVIVGDSNNEGGVIGGGAAGGLIGHAIGRNFASTAAGALVGAVGGSIIEKKIKQQVAFEYTVQIDNGGLMTIVQGRDQLFSIDQPVYVLVSQFGRSRITSQ